MLSLEDEIEDLKRSGLLAPRVAERLVAIENRDDVSVFYELRIATWAAVLVLASGVTLFVKENLASIGALTILIVLMAAAAGCQAWVWVRTRRRPEGVEAPALEEYIVLLGALLWSAAVGFGEAQFHWLGGAWVNHLLVLAVFHGAVAYLFDSRMVLGVALTSLAAWFGIDREPVRMFDASGMMGTKAIACAATVLVVRLVNERAGRRPRFDEVYEHFAANLAMWGALLWSFNDGSKIIGLVALVVFGGLLVVYARKRNESWFALYAAGYGYIGISRFVVEGLSHVGDSGVLIFGYFVLTIPVMIAVMIALHRGIRGDA